MKKMLYYGWLGHSNLGDEALLQANRELFKKIKLIKNNSLYSRFAAPGACLLGGGTYINEKVSVAPLRKIQESMPLVLNGVGVLNPKFWSVAPLHELDIPAWNRILKDCPFIGVRGPTSVELLKEQGFENVTLTGDPALSLDLGTPRNRTTKRIGLNIGMTRGILWGGDDEPVYEFYKSIAVSLLQKGFSIALISVYPDDTAQAKRLIDDLGGKAVLYESFQYTRKTREFFRSVDVFIGEKLHSVVLAHCAFTPSIMIEYRPKCDDYMRSMDLSSYNFRCDALNPEKVLDRILSLCDNNQDYIEILDHRIGFYREEQKKFAARVEAYVEGL